MTMTEEPTMTATVLAGRAVGRRRRLADARRRPARDLAYLVATSLPIDVRWAHETELVGSYHQALGEHGVDGYRIDDCVLDYRVGMLQVPFLATLGTAFSKSTKRGDEMMLTMVERALPAMRDLGSLDLVRQLTAADGAEAR